MIFSKRVRVGLVSFFVVCLMLVSGALRAEPTTQPSDQPTTAPSTAPTTQPDPGPSKPSRDKGWISGTVISPDGKPAVDMELRAEKQVPRDFGAAGGSAGKQLFKVKSDENGKFTFKELEPYSYMLIAGSQEQGWIYMEVIVEAGQINDLGQLQMVRVGGSSE